MSSAIYVEPLSRGLISVRGNYLPDGADFSSATHTLSFVGSVWNLSGGGLSVDGVGGTLGAGPSSATWSDYAVTVTAAPGEYDVSPASAGAPAAPGEYDVSPASAGAAGEPGDLGESAELGPVGNPVTVFLKEPSGVEVVFEYEPSLDGAGTAVYREAGYDFLPMPRSLFYNSAQAATEPFWRVGDSSGSIWRQVAVGQGVATGGYAAVGSAEMATVSEYRTPGEYDVSPASAGAASSPGRIEL